MKLHVFQIIDVMNKAYQMSKFNFKQLEVYIAFIHILHMQFFSKNVFSLA